MAWEKTNESHTHSGYIYDQRQLSEFHHPQPELSKAIS